MPEHVDAYIALASPWAFIACRRLPTLVRGIDCAIAVKPIRLGKVFAATGGQPLPQRHESRRAYRLVEIARWAEHLGWPMHPQPRYFPVDDTGAARTVIAARRSGADAMALAAEFLSLVWEQEANIADPDVLIAAADKAGFDGAALVEAAAGDAVTAEYDANTEEAIHRQVFGVPWFVHRDAPYWGQDRMEFLVDALRRAESAAS
jgi:2-hydroxychromene-2-carboxylate isomerase